MAQGSRVIQHLAMGDYAGSHFFHKIDNIKSRALR